MTALSKMSPPWRQVPLAVYFNWGFNAWEDSNRAAPTRHDLFMLVRLRLMFASFMPRV